MKYEEKIRWVLTIFFKITQIEALYFDTQTNIISCQFQAHMYEDFCRLGMGKIKSFLTDIFARGFRESKDFYTYYLPDNLICNISILSIDGECEGAIVTQPIALGIFKRDELKLKFSALPAKERDACIAAMLRAPVVFHDRIIPIGGTLNLLTKYVYETLDFKPIACGGETDPLSYHLIRPGKAFQHQHKPLEPFRFGGYPTYSRIKNAISKGDTEALLAAFDLTDNENITMDQHASKDIIRSVRNRLIEGCAMCSFFAIEARAPYIKTRDFTEQVIREIEETDNINDMYNLVKSALQTLTRYVAMTRIQGYTKHVRLATNYIEKHYAEEITLELLAQITGTSRFYLSFLIKKETGLSVTDIINKTRVEESKKMLVEPTMTLAAVSSKVGFANSNYFSRVFKQYTGVTPAKYSKTIATSADEDVKSKKVLRALLDQAFHTMEMFSGVFDAGRIVDPIHNKAWVMNSSGKILESTCYDFWSREKSCDRCISRLALNKKKSFLKLERGEGNPFLVSATPITIGETRFVLELLKEIEGNFFNCIGETKPSNITPQ